MDVGVAPGGKSDERKLGEILTVDEEEASRESDSKGVAQSPMDEVRYGRTMEALELEVVDPEKRAVACADGVRASR